MIYDVFYHTMRGETRANAMRNTIVSILLTILFGMIFGWVGTDSQFSGSSNQLSYWIDHLNILVMLLQSPKISWIMKCSMSNSGVNHNKNPPDQRRVLCLQVVFIPQLGRSYRCDSSCQKHYCTAGVRRRSAIAFLPRRPYRKVNSHWSLRNRNRLRWLRG